MIYTRTRYLPISLLTCRDATHWCAVGGNVERRLAAKKRPAPPDHLDANYRRARGPDNPSSLQGLSMVVHASGCVSLLLYVLLYEVDVQAAGQLGQTPAR